MTNKQTTVTLAGHARLGLIIKPLISQMKFQNWIQVNIIMEMRHQFSLILSHIKVGRGDLDHSSGLVKIYLLYPEKKELYNMNYHRSLLP